MNSEKLSNENINEKLESESNNNNEQCMTDNTDKDIKVDAKNNKSKSNRRFALVVVIFILLNFVCLIFSIIYSLELSEEIKLSKNKQEVVSQQIEKLEKNSRDVSNFASKNSVEEVYKEFALLKQKSESLEVNYNLTQKHLDSLDYKQNILDSKLSKEKSVNIWQIYEARYLISLANRKVLIDQDYLTAISLLKDADSILVALDDAKAFNLRGCIAHDINFLRNLNKIDKEGTLLQINELVSNIDSMPLKKGEIISIFENQNDSHEISNWKDNLLNSSKDFLNKFISIRKRTSKTDSELLSVEAESFLRANIQSQLILASKNFYQDDFNLYRKNLMTAKNWIEKYFEKEDSVVTNTILTIDELVLRTEKSEKIKEYITSYIAVVDYINELKNKE